MAQVQVCWIVTADVRFELAGAELKVQGERHGRQINLFDVQVIHAERQGSDGQRPDLAVVQGVPRDQEVERAGLPLSPAMEQCKNQNE